MCDIQSSYIFPQNGSKRILSKFQLCIGWGEGELWENFEKECPFLWANPEMTEKYEYCITITKTFVHDCSTIAIVLYTCDTVYTSMKSIGSTIWRTQNQVLTKLLANFSLWLNPLPPQPFGIFNPVPIIQIIYISVRSLCTGISLKENCLIKSLATERQVNRNSDWLM